MVTDFFGALLDELGKILQMPLAPDSNNSCLIKFKEGVTIQLEMDRGNNQFLIIGSDLGAIPAGKYRENLFQEALKANGMPSPRYGTFAYSKQADHLILFEMMNLQEITGGKIAEFLPFFIEKAKVWSQALTKGEIPIVASVYTSRPTGLFGLKP